KSNREPTRPTQLDLVLLCLVLHLPGPEAAFPTPLPVPPHPQPTTQTLAPSKVTAMDGLSAAAVEVGVPASLPPLAAEEADAAAAEEAAAAAKRWPGWPGDSVFRLVVPVLKVGSIIGRKGELIKRLVEETKARVRVLEGPVGATERIVLVSGKEEPIVEFPPAIDALMRVFKRVNGITDGAAEGTQVAAAPGVCAARLLVPGAQAINLIGKQGATIKAIQEGTGATIRVISIDERERPFYVTEDERIVEIQGETEKVLKALQAVSNHLRKFLVDHSVLPLFEKTNTTTVSQDRSSDNWSDMSHHSIVPPQVIQPSSVVDEYILPMKRDPLYLDRDPLVDHNHSIHRSGVSLYGRDPALSTLRPSGIHGASPLLTQITQTMQIPLTYAEDIIGVKGANIAYIRANSGAVVTIQESLGSPDDITVEIKGTSSQVQAAQQLIQDSLAAHREPVNHPYLQDSLAAHREPVRSSYQALDPVYRSSYSQYGSSTYSSSSLPSYSSMEDGRYSSSGLGGYGSRFLMSVFGILVPGVPTNCIGGIADAPAAATGGKDEGGAGTGGTAGVATCAGRGTVVGACEGAGTGVGSGGGREEILLPMSNLLLNNVL
ncbi:hypothetical protein EJB05_23358, partial [Eragrostis curvula]